LHSTTTNIAREIGTEGQDGLILLSLLHHLHMLLSDILLLHHRSWILVLWHRRRIYLGKGAKLSLLWPWMQLLLIERRL